MSANTKSPQFYKQQVAEAALDYCLQHLQKNDVLGIGTGSTANCFIQLLGEHSHRFAAATSSSEASTKALLQQGIKVIELQQVDSLKLYVDGADEIDPNLNLIKGGGAALTREKVVAAKAEQFVCIADDSKWVDVLGSFPLPVEYIPMARSIIEKEVIILGGKPVFRKGCVTDNHNHIIDIHQLQITDPIAIETLLNQVTGMVCNGIFAMRGADKVITAGENGLIVIDRNN